MEGTGDGAEASAKTAAKTALRDQLLTARRRRPLAARLADATALRDQLLAAPELRVAPTVAAYVATPDEPGTGPLLDALHELGRRVLLPVLVGDGDLDWAAYAGPDALVARRFGLLEPTTPTLGPDAVATADVVVVPGLACDRRGNRLGRGGGSYDRALARVPRGTFTCVVLHDEEILDAVPTEAHDRPVTAALTPSGISRFPGPLAGP
ncbi:5-formyltetrahydrofolate cyclo-ligase [Nocardioides massiliensis]|uniref:5-formyltetrahydrofolate cyclo-ligase n=1 Tax=Nocardioides massiliensis TaxID=1325935 RepID=A0ABT9NIP5_9ACTN|nr:5-formyltetrahydrofolate cyclo-ligase [Nocardioides massiliensis]MDP9820286.1 5-formyltetrahydrofolate cyclo-ligase [Nocardioides massiliensis]